MKDRQEKRDFLDLIPEIIASMQIAIVPAAAAIIVAFLVTWMIPGTFGMILAILIGSAGVLLGIILAIRIAKKKGAVNFMSRVSASPELDKEEDAKKNRDSVENKSNKI